MHDCGLEKSPWKHWQPPGPQPAFPFWLQGPEVTSPQNSLEIFWADLQR